MTISQTVLGPNSSLFTYTPDETTATIMSAMDTYITAQGWSVYDNAAPQGLTGTSPVGRVYRILQDGSTTNYKYVGIAINTTNLQFKIYESWNASTHVGTNDGSYYGNTTGSVGIALPTLSMYVGGATNSGFVLFVNPKWLAVRTRSAALSYSHIIGAFEYRKDFGEADGIPSVVVMTSMLSASNTSSNTGVGFFGTPRTPSGKVGGGATAVSTVCTAYGTFTNGGGGQTINTVFPTSNYVNSTLTMTAAENATNGNQYGPGYLRGRILGIKLVIGGVIWNDMDQCQVTCDSDYFQTPSGTASAHHVINLNGNAAPSSASYVRYVIPV